MWPSQMWCRVCVCVCVVQDDISDNGLYLLLLRLLSVSTPVVLNDRTKGHKVDFVVAQVSPMFKTPEGNIAQNAPIHLHNTTRDKHIYSLSLLLLLSLPWLMRELLFLAEGLFLTPSRSQMTVFAAWGPDPSSPDPVTGSVEPFH